MAGRAARAVYAMVLSAVVGAAIAGCAPGTVPGVAVPGVTVYDDLDFGAPEGIRLDVCAPAERAPSGPAIIAVHGGGWSQGDKRERPWREACEWLASEGFVVFQANYRLSPAHPYPAAIDDIVSAVEWIRGADQVERFGHDPGRLGAFGDSAGGNLVALLGTRGDGPTAVGSRVSAVVELSAPIDLTLAGTALGDLGTGFQRVQLDYLGCDSYDLCPQAADASPSRHVDASDPAFFIAHSSHEFIPVEQAAAFAHSLGEARVDVTYVERAGSGHGLALLDDALRQQISAWLHSTL